MGWRCFPHLMPASLAPALFETGDAQTMFSNGDQLGHEQAHHSVKETAGLDFNADHVALPIHEHLLDRRQSVSATTSGSHERTKVVVTKHPLKSGIHPVCVEAHLVAVPCPGS